MRPISIDPEGRDRQTGNTAGATGTPGTPGTSDTFGTPDTSGTFGTPDTSGTSGTPDTSGTPGTPDTPGTPGATGTPDAAIEAEVAEEPTQPTPPERPERPAPQDRAQGARQPGKPGLPGQRTSSAERGGRPAVEETTTAVASGGSTITVARSSLRPARLNRPLMAGQASSSLGWADPHLDRLLNEAMERAQATATAKGYAEGLQQGRDEAAEAARVEALRRKQERREHEQELASHVNLLLTALQQAVQQQSEELVPAWDELADTLVEGAMRIVKNMIDRELTSLDAQALQALRIAVRSLSGSRELQVRMNPEDLLILTQATGEDSPEAFCPPGVLLLPDPTVPRGGVQAQATAQRVKVFFSEAIARAEEVLQG